MQLDPGVHCRPVRPSNFNRTIMLSKQQSTSLHSISDRQPMLCHRHSSAVVSSRQRPCKQQQQQRLPPTASSYTQPALEAIRAAQQQACRQGSIFVAPPHLLLGLLDVPHCTAAQLLQAAGLTAAAADAALVDPELLPKSSFMAAGDLHWAPDARVALGAAAEAAQAAGLSAAGTPHLLLGLLTCSNTAVAATLDGAGIPAAAFEGQVRAAAGSCSEAAAAQPASAEEQRAALVQNYMRHVQQHGTAPPQGAAAGLGQQGSSAGNMAMTLEDDDIYN